MNDLPNDIDKPVLVDFEPVPRWGALPQGISFGGDATSVSVDSNDNVYVFNRGNMPVMVFDRDGQFLDAWGEGDFDSPHGVYVDGNDDIYLVDTGGHFVQKRNCEGKVLFTLGVRGEPAPLRSGIHFNRPTDVVVHPITQEVFVADGYGNARIHRFSADGGYIQSFGEPGADDGQFCLPHGIDFLDGERIVVCDRENFRLQVFTLEGEYLEQWHAHRPAAVRRARGSGLVFVAEI
jgi:DNA-binding beta-propeller fold protein YncE